jgi:hypothetical protein
MTTYNNENHDILIGTDDEWTVSIDDESDDDDFQYDCSCDYRMIMNMRKKYNYGLFSKY